VSEAFPEGFIWGAATAAHQVEGGNFNSDVWALEQAQPSIFREPSGDAIDQWNRFADDVAILAGLGLGAYRFSIEWARIEPEEGVFAQSALDHYQRCIDACLERGVAPIVTFHHFAQPRWQARNGGLTDPKFPDRFARFCERASAALRGFDTACTINELNLPLFIRGQLLRRLQKDESGALRAAAEAALGGPVEHTFLFTPREAVLDQALRAHAKGRDAIKAAHPRCQVGVTLAIQDEQAEPGAEDVRDRRNAEAYDDCLEAVRGDDFIGVQTYTRLVSQRDGRASPMAGRPRNALGWEDYPEAIANTCRYVWKKTRTPIIVTENGWAGDETRRGPFVTEALQALHAAISEGVDVRGYLYWTLLDNFEWMSGYEPKFGLIGVDRATQRREIRPSAVAFGQIARRNSLAPGDDRRATTQEVSADQAASPVGIG
jgi:beta-glucosidase